MKEISDNNTDDLLNSLEIINNLGYIKDKSLYELCKTSCEFHDYGKVNNDFRTRIKNFTKQYSYLLIEPYWNVKFIKDGFWINLKRNFSCL
ncbi:MAG: hypothetical protein R3Y33_05995 [Clostridia bacterium]